MLYVQYQGVAHTYSGSPTGSITFQVQIVQACGAATIHMVYPDTDFGMIWSPFNGGASATVGYVGRPTNGNALWSFMSAALPSGISLTITLNGVTSTWSSPLGTGSLAVALCAGNALGTYQMFATVNAGAFPGGWLFGLDLTYSEFIFEFGTPPFRGPLNASGEAFLGPFTGLPPGLNIYSVVFSIDPSGLATSHTPPAAYTVP